MLSGRLNNRCQVFPVNTSRTLYTGDVILGVAESHAKDIVVTSVSSLITSHLSARGHSPRTNVRRSRLMPSVERLLWVASRPISKHTGTLDKAAELGVLLVAPFARIRGV